MRKIFPAIIILMLFVTGCSKVDSRFVGVWKSQGQYSRTISILPDGTGGHSAGSSEFFCSVKTTENLIVFEYEVSNVKRAISYSVVTVTDTEMTLVGNNGTYVFKKL